MAKKPTAASPTGSLMSRLQSNSTIKDAAILDKTKFWSNRDSIKMHVPMLNAAFTGDLDYGYGPGLTVWAGPSKHFKSFFSLLCVKAYLDKYPDAVCIFYDNEFGTLKSYWQVVGIDTSRVLHVPLYNIEEWKFDIAAQLNNIQLGDKVIIFVDSVGNIASKKEVEDALEQNSAADMTRAKQLKSVFRIVTPHIERKNIPMIVVNHTYDAQDNSKTSKMGGGTGPYYSAQSIFFLGRQQDKDAKGLNGFNFIINIEKSRLVREKMKIPVYVGLDGFVDVYSGLLEEALEAGFVTKPNVGWYQKVDQVTGELIGKKYREDETSTADFFDDILSSQKFKEFIRKKYRLAQADMLQSTAEDSEEDEDNSAED